MGKILKFSEGVEMMNFAAFCYVREYFERTGEEPTVEMIEEQVKFRFEDYCRVEGIEYIEED